MTGAAPNTWEMRIVLKKRFGSARAVEHTDRQALYDLGVPPVDPKNPTVPIGPAFAEKTNLILKFQEVETEMGGLWDICPEKCRKTYKYGTE